MTIRQEQLLASIRSEDKVGMLVTFGMLDRAGVSYSDAEVIGLAKAGKVSLCECSDPYHYQTRLIRVASGKAFLGLALIRQ